MNRIEIEKKIIAQKMTDPDTSQARALCDEISADILAYDSAGPFAGGEGRAIAAGDPAEPSLQKICMTMQDSTSIVEDLRKNRRLALTGSPGYGRVFAAQELAYALIGKEDPQKVVIAQFDEDYTFQDFLGAPPLAENFLYSRGLFVKLCLQAAAHPEESYVYVVNETQPGKAEEIFSTFEKEAKDETILKMIGTLYDVQAFAVPSNLYILALLAVTGEQKTPATFTSHLMQASMHLDELQKQQDVPRLAELRSVLNIVEGINKTVSAEDALGKKYSLEQNFMCPCALSGGDDVLAFEVQQDLLPLIAEYCRACIGRFTEK